MATLLTDESRTAVCRYLREKVFPRIVARPYGSIEISRLSKGKQVFLCRETGNNISVVVKYYETGNGNDHIKGQAEHEYANLVKLREQYGLCGNPDRVVAPLGAMPRGTQFLVIEKAAGKTLDYFVKKAIRRDIYQPLYDKLRNLARFFAYLHRVTRTEIPAGITSERLYLVQLLQELECSDMHGLDSKRILKYAHQWWHLPDTGRQDTEVMVHGDATPTNFLFKGDMVTAIDLEKMKYADRCRDLGFMTAELKHHFQLYSGNGWAAEPFIGHFLWQYSVYLGSTDIFYIITEKLPLYMCLGLLRIARNTWLHHSHREYLIREARRCLKYGR